MLMVTVGYRDMEALEAEDESQNIKILLQCQVH